MAELRGGTTIAGYRALHEGNISDYLQLVGGSGSGIDADLLDGMDSSSSNAPSTIVARDSNGNFAAGTITAALTGNATSASKWASSINLSLTGSVTGSASIDGSGNVSLATTTNHTHAYLPLSGGDLTGNVNIVADNTDKFITFKYTGSNLYDWRIGYLGTGSGDANYLTFQSSGSGVFVDALKIGLTSYAATFLGSVTAPSFTGSLSGNASSASVWATSRSISLTGGVTGTVTGVNGGADISIATTLKNHTHSATAGDGGQLSITDATTGTLTVARGGTGTTSFTGGRVLFGAGTSAINTSGNLFWDNTNARLGIGTAAPTVRLTVTSTKGGDSSWNEGILIENTGSAGESALSFKNSVTGNDYWIHGLNQTADLRWAYGATFSNANTYMSLIANGNLGVGVTSPSEKLDVSGFIKSSSGYKVGTNTVIDSSRVGTLTKLGIGTTAPSENVDVVGVVKTSEGFKTGTFHIVYDEQSSCLNFCVN